MKNKLFLLAPLFLLFAVATYYVLTTSSSVRLWTDDFCSSVTLRNNGYLGSQVFWWKSWTGRYSYIAFLDLVELFGQVGAQVLPVVLYILSLATNLPLTVLSLLFLINSPNIIQSFYWMTGSLNYFAPFVFLNFFLLLLFRETKRYFVSLAFVLLFVATGFSEAFGIANILLLSFLYLIFEKKEKRKIIIAGLVSTVASLAIMSLSPGNAVRSAAVSHPENILDLATKTLIYSKWYLIHLFYIKTFMISALTIIVGIFIFLDSKLKYFQKPKVMLIVSPIFIVSVTLAVVGLTYYAMNWEPPERVMSIVNNMIIIGIAIFAVGLFQLTNKLVSKKLLKFVFVGLVLLLTNQVRLDWGKVRNEVSLYATEWDKTEELLVKSKEYKEIKVPNIKMVGKLDGMTDNGGWILGCISAYYGTGRIIVE